MILSGPRPVHPDASDNARTERPARSAWLSLDAGAARSIPHLNIELHANGKRARRMPTRASYLNQCQTPQLDGPSWRSSQHQLLRTDRFCSTKSERLRTSRRQVRRASTDMDRRSSLANRSTTSPRSMTSRFQPARASTLWPRSSLATGRSRRKTPSRALNCGSSRAHRTQPPDSATRLRAHHSAYQRPTPDTALA